LKSGKIDSALFIMGVMRPGSNTSDIFLKAKPPDVVFGVYNGVIPGDTP